jgi:hypothetical protein
MSAAKSTANILYKPAATYRVRWNMNTDTPIPQEEPAGENPPDGAIIDYYLPANANNVSLEVWDSKGKLVRKFTNTDTMYKIPAVNIPLYWIRPQEILSAARGAHRFVWDLHYEPLNVPASYPIAAIYKNTAPNETSPWVMPGNYKVKLIVDGQSQEAPLTIKMDPRVKTPVLDLQSQHDLSVQAYESRKEIMKLMAGVKPGELQASLGRLAGTFAGVFSALQDSDSAPTTQAKNALKEAKANLEKLKAQIKDQK